MCYRSVAGTRLIYWYGYLRNAVFFILLVIFPHAFSVYIIQAIASILKSFDETHNHGLILERKIRGFVGLQLFNILDHYMPTEYVMYGEFDKLDGKKSYILIPNHQIYTDWLVLWNTFHKWDAQKNIKIILKKTIFKLPLMGSVIKNLGFIGIERKWSEDKVVLWDNLSVHSTGNQPIWLIIFPEGTVITDEMHEKSMETSKTLYADRCIKTKYVLAPKFRGTSWCIDKIRERAASVVDVTIAYEGIKPEQRPYYIYTFAQVFFARRYPRRVHINLKVFNLKNIPGKDSKSTNKEESEKQFSNWLVDVYLDKDKLLDEYHKAGRFPSNNVAVFKCNSSIPLKVKIGWIACIIFSFAILSFIFSAFAKLVKVLLLLKALLNDLEQGQKHLKRPFRLHSLI